MGGAEVGGGGGGAAAGIEIGSSGDGTATGSMGTGGGSGGGGGVVGVGTSGGSLALAEWFNTEGRLSSRTGGAGGSRWEGAGLLKKKHRNRPVIKCHHHPATRTNKLDRTVRYKTLTSSTTFGDAASKVKKEIIKEGINTKRKLKKKSCIISSATAESNKPAVERTN